MICRDCGKEFFDEEHPKRRLCDDCRREHRRLIEAQRWLKIKSDTALLEANRRKGRECAKRHRETLAAYKKKYYREHQEQLSERYKAYYHEHREAKKAYAREQWKNLSEEDKNRKRLNRKLKKSCTTESHKPFCQWCGRDFTPKYKGEKYCSEECYSHSPLRQIYERNPKAIKFLIDIFFRNGN